MRSIVVVLLLGVWVVDLHADDPKTITFAKADEGKIPKGWVAAKTGAGEGSVWRVTKDDTTPSKSGYALAQIAEGPNPLFNVCVLNDSKFLNGLVSVSVRSVKGKLDQGGGVVWRYRDENNYYICRYNPIETNFRLYHIKDGKRTQLATKAEVTIKEGEWVKVSVSHINKNIQCFLDGKKMFEVTDDTFSEAGKVGVWSKADAHSHFDNFRFTPADK